MMMVVIIIISFLQVIMETVNEHTNTPQWLRLNPRQRDLARLHR